MKKALFIIDIQEPFMNVYTKKLPLKIIDFLDHNYFDYIVLGKFVNQVDSPFVKRLRMTCCLEPNTGVIDIMVPKEHVVMEHSSYTLHTEEVDQFLKEHHIKYIYLCGVSTDGSIYKTALDLFENNYSVYVLKGLCASTAGERNHDMAVSLLEDRIGKDFVI